MSAAGRTTRLTGGAELGDVSAQGRRDVRLRSRTLVWLAASIAAVASGCAAAEALPRAGGPQTEASLAWVDRMALERAVAADAPRHQPVRTDRGFVLRSGASMVHIDGGGAHLGASSGHLVTLGAVAIGRDDARALDPSPALQANGPEVQLTRAADVREWWRSLPSGLEHGVTLAARIDGTGPLRLDIATDAAVAAAGPDSVLLRDSSGAVVARYGHVVAVDARGETHPARLLAHEHGIRIEVDDAGAQYPLVIDPLVVTEEALLLPAVASGARAGCDVATNRDGTIALVGVYNDDRAPGGMGAGTVHVFTRSGRTWSEVQTLVPSDSAMSAYFGIVVGITPDGSRVVVGASYDNSAAPGSGSVYVFRGAPGSYAQEAKLTVPAAQMNDYVGSAVAISDDGSIVIAGASWADTAAGVDAGNVHVFTRAGTTWALATTLTASHAGPTQHFGYGLALAGDGSRLAIGALDGDTLGTIGPGEGYVFVRNGTTWTEEANLQPSNGAIGDWFGAAAAISANGDRVAFGAPNHAVGLATRAGEIVVFARAGTTWLEEASLVESDAASNARLGSAVAMTPDGALILGGERGSTRGCPAAGAGRVSVFTRVGTRWMEETALVHAGALRGDRIGYSVALSDDGTRAVVGGIQLDSPTAMGSGGAIVFALRACSASGACCDIDRDCDDGNACTTDQCSGPGGTCSHGVAVGCCTTATTATRARWTRAPLPAAVTRAWRTATPAPRMLGQTVASPSMVGRTARWTPRSTPARSTRAHPTRRARSTAAPSASAAARVGAAWVAAAAEGRASRS